MAAAKPQETIIIENVSRRLHIIAGVYLAPTQAQSFPAEVLNNGGVKIAFDLNELKLGEEIKEPITDEKEAEKELERRAAERAGKGGQIAKTDASGAPAAKVNAGK
ncbi:hypothetical protein [Pantoea phage Nafs113]|nr:hypothetical protein [Pantoea phage Nafs113]